MTRQRKRSGAHGSGTPAATPAAPAVRRSQGRLARRLGLGLGVGVLVWCAVSLAQQPPPAPPAQPKASVAASASASLSALPRPSASAPASAAPSASATTAPASPPGAGALPPGHPAVDPQRGNRARSGAEARTPMAPPVAPAAAHDEASAHGAPGAAHGGAHEEGECGRGPDARPPEVNWFHGILGVDNDAAPDPLPDNAGFWDRLLWKLKPSLWRYENKNDPCDRRNEPIPLFANLLNFAIFAFLLVRFGRKPVREALAKRKAGIMSDIEKAAAIRGEAQKRLTHFQGELDHLDTTLDALRAQFHEEGVSEEKRLIDEMGSVRDRMLSDAEFRITQDQKTARDELSRAALEGALSAAESLISRAITAADHERLAETYLEHLGHVLSGREVRA